MNRITALAAITASVSAQDFTVFKYGSTGCTGATTSNDIVSVPYEELKNSTAGFASNSTQFCYPSAAPAATGCARTDAAHAPRCAAVTLAAGATDTIVCVNEGTTQKLALKYSTDGSSAVTSVTIHGYTSEACPTTTTDLGAEYTTSTTIATAAISDDSCDAATRFYTAANKLCFVPSAYTTSCKNINNADGSCFDGAGVSYKAYSTTKRTICTVATAGACVSTGASNCVATTVYGAAPPCATSTAGTTAFYNNGTDVCISVDTAAAGTCDTTATQCASAGSTACQNTTASTTAKSWAVATAQTTAPKSICFAKDCTSTDNKRCYEIGTTCHKRGSTYFKFSAGTDFSSVNYAEYSDAACATSVATGTVTSGICYSLPSTRRRLALAQGTEESAVFTSNSATVAGAVATAVASVVALRI